LLLKAGKYIFEQLLEQDHSASPLEFQEGFFQNTQIPNIVDFSYYKNISIENN